MTSILEKCHAVKFGAQTRGNRMYFIMEDLLVGWKVLYIWALPLPMISVGIYLQMRKKAKASQRLRFTKHVSFDAPKKKLKKSLISHIMRTSI